jgi:flagellin-like protein
MDIRMHFNNKKGLSPVISAIILIAVTVAVAIAATTWLGSMSLSFMSTEEIHISSCQWAEDSSYVDLTVKNFGTSSVTLESAQVSNADASSISFVSGDSTINAGEEAIMRVYFDYSTKTKYQFSVSTSKGQKFFYISTSPLDSSITFKMEWGTTTINDTYKQVNLQNNYVSPVIVCTPKYTSDVPRSIRITDVTSQSFKARVQNPSATSCPNTEISYLVVEEGVWTTPIKLEAVKYSTNTVGRKSNWNYDIRDYQQTYSGNIIVLHQIMSCNDPEWITTYTSRKTSASNPPNSGDDGFRIALNGAEAATTHANELIGYIIFEQSFGEISGIKYDITRTSDFVRGYGNSPPYKTAYSQSFDNTPTVLLATQLEADGGDGGWIATHTISQTQAGLMIDEDQVNDSERNHTTETCGFLAFESEGSYS